MSIKDNVQTFQNEFSLFEDVLDLYEYIIELGKKLSPLNEQYKVELYKVQGCQSQVWLHPYMHEGKVILEATSDAAIVRGLVYILIQIYSRHTPKEILMTEPSILESLNLNEVISSGRQNGVASMLRRIYTYAGEYNG